VSRAATVAAALAGLVVDGGAAALGAAAGVLLAAASFSVSVWAVAGAEKIDIRLTLPVALLTYGFKLVVIGAALWAVRSSGWDVVLPMAAGVVGGALAWLTTQGIWIFRAKIPYIELDERS
jgi:hypothetical protein